MNISHKYHIRAARTQAVAQLSLIFSPSLPEQNTLVYSRKSKSDQTSFRMSFDLLGNGQILEPRSLNVPDLLDAIRLSWEHDLQDILPVAACWLFTWDTVTTDFLFDQSLPMALLKLLLSGWGRILGAISTKLLGFLLKLGKCTSSQCVRSRRLLHGKLCDVSAISLCLLWMWADDFDSDGFCPTCKQGLEWNLDFGRSALWYDIPNCFFPETPKHKLSNGWSDELSDNSDDD